ncbi:hypothetical protein [Mesorhizobium sp. dw_380]|uniref:hypothetical protein n=1 Tax=Mesorhizobium sp. dw_380 TaxID=2812001 RepID=UPI001BDE59BB|nr:hypothetical protein [Mesorhizobium sp. dw_380]
MFGILPVFEFWTRLKRGRMGRREVLPHFGPSPARPRRADTPHAFLLRKVRAKNQKSSEHN